MILLTFRIAVGTVDTFESDKGKGKDIFSAENDEATEEELNAILSGKVFFFSHYTLSARFGEMLMLPLLLLSRLYLNTTLDVFTTKSVHYSVWKK